MLRIWLSELSFIGPVLAGRLLERFSSADALRQADKNELMTVQGIGEKRAEEIIINNDFTKAESIYESCISTGINPRGPADPLFKGKLMLLSEPPVIVYTKGICGPDIFSKTAGIVGSRRCTRLTRDETINIADKFAGNGYTIISGMARGVDSYAHTAAVKKDCPTVAVLGCGVDICYPPEHITLMDRILEHGLIISEYPPGTPPTVYTFPRRNRLIAALSDLLIITAAAEKSGSLTTAEEAAKLNKAIYVPSEPCDRDHAGCVALIEEGRAYALSDTKSLLPS